VWAGVHAVTRRPVALKCLKQTKEHARRRFLREARAAAALEHPNVVAVHDLVELSDGALVMVMELLDGETLAARLQRRQRLALGEAAPIALDVVAAIRAAHAAGIIHRDLKPENIFLVAGGAAKVLDFGIAKLTAEEGDAARTRTLTRTGDVIGTPFYMSPEQVFGERDLDGRADVWSLGVILYECLTGRRPFQGENAGQIVKAIVQEERAAIGRAAEVPRDVAQLIGRMLERERAARLGDLVEV
jgi:serine/threonine protein kinase